MSFKLTEIAKLDDRSFFEDKGCFHFYDWFCKDTSLERRATRLIRKVRKILQSSKLDINKQYVFFKNNCPIGAPLYDDFRICDIESGNVVYTIIPGKNGEIWGSANGFSEPLFEGSWKEIAKWFND